MFRTISALMFAAAILCVGPMARAADASADPRMVEHGLGNAKAKVRIDEYYSLDCPHCAAFVVETLPQMTKDYIDTGKVYLVLHDFPLHEPALRATMLARCVPPDRFFPVVDTLFRVQQGWVGSMDALKQQAKFAGLTDAQIDACLNDRGLEDAILNERLDAEKAMQIEATPTFIFNQKPADKIVSAAPYADFQKKIDGLLK
jgi:protein-disulfide isomerase